MSEIDSWVSENLSAIARSLEKCLTDQSGQEDIAHLQRN